MRQILKQISSTNQTANAHRHQLVLKNSDPASEPSIACNRTHVMAEDRPNNRVKWSRSRLLRKQSVIFRSHSGILGKLLIRRISQSASFSDQEFQSTSGTYHSRASSWAFMPSFLSRGFEYQSWNTSGFIQRAIRIYPLIRNDHPIWKMCTYGDLRGIQHLLSARQVSPFSVDAEGLTLLHVSRRNTFKTFLEYLT
jgi:hypothetical protein